MRPIWSALMPYFEDLSRLSLLDGVPVKGLPTGLYGNGSIRGTAKAKSLLWRV